MIYLKKIEIYGFKSFADKLELEFNHPITGIVGPNGCGKSNVSDAIRWVLGEQSTKSLRGKLMQDLIFSGTDTRKSMSYCEVSLFMDNTTRIFPIQMDEVVISRKLYRNNESQYFLNRNVVRLSDILAMLRSVGLGREGYSIVGQGRMNAILNARPEDRRAVFEEALGISSFRKKKNETERKLEKTAENINNLAILEKELSDRIGPLKRQAATAKKYLELEDKLRYNEINAYIFNYDNSSDQKEKSRQKIDGLNEELLKKELDYDNVNEEYDQLFHQVTDIDSTITKLRERQLVLSVDLEKLAGDSKLIHEKIKGVTNEISNTDATIASNNSEIERLNGECQQNKVALEKRLGEQANLENDIAQLNEQLAQIAEKTEGVQSSLNQKQQEHSATVAQIAENKQKIALANSEKQTIEARLNQIEQQQNEISLRLNNLNSEGGDLLKHIEELKNLRENLTTNTEQTKKEIKTLEYSIFEAGKVVKCFEQEVAGIRGGIDFLRDFSENYKGFFSSVQSLMQDRQGDRVLASKICGVVANLLKVNEDFQLAIETALGSKLQNIVTETEEDAKYIIQHLKNKGLGRVTFLPLSSVKPRDIERREVLKERGVLGIAKDLISFDAKFAPVFNCLLGGVVVVDTFDNAVSISKRYGYVHNIVTLTGERLSRDGSIEGGSKKTSNSLLSYESQIGSRSKLLEEKLQALSNEESNYKSLEEQLTLLRQKYTQLQEALATVNIEIATDKQRIETSDTLNKTDKRNILQLETEKDTILQRIRKLKETIEGCAVKLEQLTESERVLNFKVEELKSVVLADSSGKDALQANLTSKQFRLATLGGNIENLKKELTSFEVSLFKLNDENSRKLSYKKQIEQALEILQQQLLEVDNQSSGRSELAVLVEQIQSTDKLKAEMNEKFQKVSSLRTQLSVEVESVRSAIDKEKYILSRIDEDLQELQQRVLEQYGITYSAAMEHKDPSYDVATSKQTIADLRLSIQKLGYVNVNAIEELTSVEERFGNIDTQMTDLKNAESDLKDILHNLIKEIEVRFEDGLVKIDENFKLIFRELFKGGNAKLVLDKDPEKDPLDYGIEIEAQPPGKRLQNILLLSGGEQSLTASAILFAILRLRPMPFCVLDEIEAALDDANAERIARYLKTFSNDTQFIVITHKKPTMENADILYGVTMEEKGVTKVVSVKLSEATKQAI